MIKYSYILPIKDEALSLPQLISEISRTHKSKNYEIIACDDASTDNSLAVLNSLKEDYPQLKIIHLKSHQGKWASLQSGFQLTQGQFIITLDSDLQDDPREVLKLLKKLHSGYDLVSGARLKRFDPIYKIWISRFGNLLVSIITKKRIRDLNSPFKVYRKEVFTNLPRQGSMMRFSLLFAALLHYKYIEVPIIHRPRIYGYSKFGFTKYVRILYDLVLIILLFSGSGRLKKIK